MLKFLTSGCKIRAPATRPRSLHPCCRGARVLGFACEGGSVQSK